jgi:hypothetical protein
MLLCCVVLCCVVLCVCIKALFGEMVCDCSLTRDVDVLCCVVLCCVVLCCVVLCIKARDGA